MYGEDDHCRAKLVQVYRFTRCAATLVRSSLNLLVASCLCNIFSLFTVRCSARHASAVYATVILSVILSIHLSVCLSVTLVYCIRAKWLNKRVFFRTEAIFERLYTLCYEEVAFFTKYFVRILPFLPIFVVLSHSSSVLRWNGRQHILCKQTETRKGDNCECIEETGSRNIADFLSIQ